jgi:hypothetical protein
MTFIDWFLVGLAGYLGVISAPFLLALAIFAVIVVVVIAISIYAWAVDFCKTGWNFFLFCIGRWP